MVQKRDDLKFEIILLLLKEKRGYVRGIAKALGQSHTTILRKLNSLEKEKVLSHKRENNKKNFFIKNDLQAKNYILNAERYKLNKLLKKYPELNTILPIISNWVIIDNNMNETNEKMIILFGSYAEFKAKKDSNIDIYVETRNKKIKEEIESINPKINVKIGDFNISSLLIREIIKNHIILRGEEEFYEKIDFFE